MKKIIVTLITAIVLLYACGCGEIPVPTGQATIDPEQTTSPYESWTPLQFSSGQTMVYNFNIKVDTGIIDGRFALKVTGKAPAGLYFDWEYTYNNIEEFSDSGHYFGSSEGFIEKLSQIFQENNVMSSVYESLFTPLENNDLYSQLVAQYSHLESGETWTSVHNKVTYTHKIGEKATYGGVEGYEVETYTQENDLVPIQTICLSPYCVLPTMSLFLIESSTAEDFNYVICELVGTTVE